jgi:outer membrane protein assembly factor BamB
LDKFYFLSDYFDTDHNQRGTIWANGKKLSDGEITRIYVDNGNVYYNDLSGVYLLNAEGASQVLGVETLRYAVADEKIYYAGDGNRLYCYNMNDKTNTLVFDGPLMFFHVDSDYIVCHSPHDIFILDTKSYTVIKEIHSEDFTVGCSVDNDNVYVLEIEFTDDITKSISRITKYDMEQDEQTEIFYSYETVSGLLAIDDKIIFTRYTEDYQIEFNISIR